jgi:hypothetical protein
MSLDIIQLATCKESAYLTCCNSILSASLVSKYSCLNSNNAHCIGLWRNFETDIKPLPDNSNVVCVYDATYFTNGNSCTWTVPAGATKARFELWGPGGSSGSTNCCGVTPAGATGTWIGFTIPVTAGCSYTLCAASSNDFCPYCIGCTQYAQACCNGSCYSSYATGYGLCNICARGGCTDFVQSQCARLCRIGFTYALTGCCPTPATFGNECCYAAGSITGSGICRYYSLCSPVSPTYAVTPAADWNVYPCGCISSSVGLGVNSPIFKLPSFHQGIFIDGSTYGMQNMMSTYPKCGWMQSNSTLSSCLTCFPCNNISISYDVSPCCLGLSSCANFPAYSIPGMGGLFTAAYAGAVGYYGDRGKGGFVKVIYSTGNAACCICSN